MRHFHKVCVIYDVIDAGDGYVILRGRTGDTKPFDLRKGDVFEATHRIRVEGNAEGMRLIDGLIHIGFQEET